MKFPTPRTIRALDIRPSKKRGQNFLIDSNLARKTVTAAGIGPADTVLEIGPGLGSLTHFIVQCASRAVLIEVDSRLHRLLHAALASQPSIVVENRDILTVSLEDYSDGGMPLVVIGSIPYYITSPLIKKCLSQGSVCSKALFIMQHEVAARLCAEPGTRQYGLMTVYCRAYAETSLLFTLPPEAFYPKPDVMSAAVMIVPHADRCWNSPGENVFRHITALAFSHRRKTLLNNLKGLLKQHGISPETFGRQAADSGIDLARRAETLSVHEFDALTRLVNRFVALA